MYINPGFIELKISPTTSSAFYPQPQTDQTTGEPIACMPIVVHPPMHAGTTSPSPGPSRIKVRAFSPGLTELESVHYGYICWVNHDGSLTRGAALYADLDHEIEGPDAVVIEKIETVLPIGVQLLGFSDQAGSDR
ncbi:hypothetical protein [Lysobacter brunescens]|uniref:Uncharacterized protein n=1 Tax=Lysobacter brunescens TaxID=262323 RepID=A0ABW2YER8_9GAMM